jgi:hypothetical protein
MRCLSACGPTAATLKQALVQVLSFALVANLVGCSDDGSPTEPPGGPVTNPDSVTMSVGPHGGAVLLEDGAGVIFPPGAVGQSVPVSVVRVDPADHFSPDHGSRRVILATTAPVTGFQQPVQIRVPLPSGMSTADISDVYAGLLDPETGAVEIEDYSIVVEEGTPYLVVTSTHFSRRVFTWFVGARPPVSAGPLVLNYYSQGASPYCWAASLHMLTQAVSYSQQRSLTDIIGRVGVNEGGITAGEFRLGRAVEGILRERTGVRPDRQSWGYVNLDGARDLIRRQIGVHGRPVAVFHGGWEHAVVFIGYDGSDFYIHDPASTNINAVGYEVRKWADIAASMKPLVPFVTAVLPAPIRQVDGPVTANFLSGVLQFIEPAHSPGDLSALWVHRWDHERAAGYSFAHASTGDRPDDLPGRVRTLSTPGQISIANASRTEARDLSIHVHVSATGAPTGQGYFTYQGDLTVPANGLRSFQPPAIPVDTFRYNRAGATEYLYSVTVLGGGEVLDGQTMVFRISGLTPRLDAISPISFGHGNTVTLVGEDLGTMSFGNLVTVGGAKVTEVVSWSDREVKVIVPADAPDDGQVILTRGTVPSNGIDYEIMDVQTVQREIVYTAGEEPTVTVSGTWTLTGAGARIGMEHTYAPNIFTLQVRAGTVASIEFSMEAARWPETVTRFGTVITYHEPVLQPWFTESNDAEWDRSGDGKDFIIHFHLPRWNSYICTHLYGSVPVTYNYSDGRVHEGKLDFAFGRICVDGDSS